MAVGLRNTATSTSDTLDLTISKPSGTVDGDMMIALIGINDQAIDSVPSGWTLLDNSVTSGFRNILYYKRASGEPTDYTWSVLSGQSVFHGAITSWTGVLLNPVHEVAVDLTSTNPVTGPSIVANSRSKVLDVLAARRGSVDLPTYTASVGTELFDFGNASGTISFSMALYERSPDLGSTGTILGNTITASVAIQSSVARTILLVGELSDLYRAVPVTQSVIRASRW